MERRAAVLTSKLATRVKKHPSGRLPAGGVAGNSDDGPLAAGMSGTASSSRCVWVARRGEDPLARPLSTIRLAVHDRHAVSELGHDGEVG